jgi:hypothetical protein
MISSFVTFVSKQKSHPPGGSMVLRIFRVLGFLGFVFSWKLAAGLLRLFSIATFGNLGS